MYKFKKIREVHILDRGNMLICNPEQDIEKKSLTGELISLDGEIFICKTFLTCDDQMEDGVCTVNCEVGLEVKRPRPEELEPTKAVKKKKKKKPAKSLSSEI